MRQEYSFRQIQRSVQKQRIRDFCALLLFLLLLPYACSLFLGKGGVYRESPLPQAGCRVEWVTPAGVQQLDLDIYLAGSLAASIPADCEPETLKAQAVILRTLCLRELEEKGSISAEELGQAYASPAALRKEWGEEFAARYAAMQEAVENTEGIVLQYNGKMAQPAYFWLSNGKSRNGAEVLDRDDLPYLKSVDCSWDVKAGEYNQETELPLSEFAAVLREELDLPVGEKLGGIVLTKDSAGYIDTVQIGEETISGESFRSLFGLPSACFTIEAEKDGVTVSTKGVGHGLGFSQFSANEKAKQGEDFISLLRYFFPGTEIEKFE